MYDVYFTQPPHTGWLQWHSLHTKTLKLMTDACTRFFLGCALCGIIGIRGIPGNFYCYLKMYDVYVRTPPQVVVLHSLYIFAYMHNVCA